MTTAPARTHNRQATCDAILNATAEIITEKGIDSFTISEVARRGEINRALVYHYYQNRENLITHAIDRLMERYNVPETSLSGDAVARSARSYIEHPEIGRFVFQLLLSGRPLLRVGERLQEQISHIQELLQEQYPDGDTGSSPAFSVIILAASCFAWSFAREELASIVGMDVDEADDRFVESISRISELGLLALQQQIQQNASAKTS